MCRRCLRSWFGSRTKHRGEALLASGFLLHECTDPLRRNHGPGQAFSDAMQSPRVPILPTRPIVQIEKTARGSGRHFRRSEDDGIDDRFIRPAPRCPGQTVDALFRETASHEGLEIASCRWCACHRSDVQQIYRAMAPAPTYRHGCRVFPSKTNRGAMANDHRRLVHRLHPASTIA